MATETMNSSRSINDSKLRDLFVEQLQDLYWAEKKLLKALEKMSDKASSPRLKEAFDTHREQTKGHVNRLEAVFSSIDEPADTTKCPAMAGIIEEANDLIDDTDAHSSQRDAGLVIAAQKAEHYEIASYGSLAQLAEVMGFMEAKDLLGQTLQEEKAADVLLTEIARSGINYSAAAEVSDTNRDFL
jgi:ferritin-like metal-binding protein YciE